MEFTTAQAELIRAELSEIDMEAYVVEMIDECQPMVKVCGMTYSPSYAIRELDPVAFRCMVADAFDPDIMTELDNGEFYWTHEVETLLEDAE